MTELPKAAVEAALEGADYIPNEANRKWMRSAITAALSHLPAYTVERELREALTEMSTIRFGCSGMSFDAVNDWFNERARSALSRAPAPERKVVEYIDEAGRPLRVDYLNSALERTVATAEPVAWGRWSPGLGWYDATVAEMAAVTWRLKGDVVRPLYASPPALPDGWRTVPDKPTRDWAVHMAEQQQGQSSTPRCEPPGEANIRWCWEKIEAVLASAPMQEDAKW